MKLWLVESKGWGVEFNIVRAETAEAAKAVAHVYGNADVRELSLEGGEAVLWSYDYSPDSPND